VVDALLELNPKAKVTDRGSYLRVSAPGRCFLTEESVRKRTGLAFHFPMDLEQVMPSFQGKISFSKDGAEWKEMGS
jgi:hypothetical protein